MGLHTDGVVPSVEQTPKGHKKGQKGQGKGKKGFKGLKDNPQPRRQDPGCGTPAKVKSGTLGALETPSSQSDDAGVFRGPQYSCCK